MSLRITRLYPFLFGLIPILNYAARNPDQFRFGDLALLVGLAVVGCGAVYGLARLAAGRRYPAALAPFVTLLAVGWFYAYPMLALRMSDDPAHPRHLALLLVAFPVCAGLVWWLRRREAWLEGLGRYLTLMGGLLVGWSTIQMGLGLVRGHNAIARSSLVAQLARPIEAPGTAPEPRRDIYLIVLDEYANSAVLRERFGFDNRPFEDSLRALGFYLPRVVRSNYAHTLLSLPSLLNTAHLAGLEAELGPRSRHPALPNHLLEYNRVVPFLEARGYRYVFFPSQWWNSTSESPEADVKFRAWTGFDLGRMMTDGELQRTVRGGSMLRYLDRDHGWEAKHVRRTLNGVAGLARFPAPTFAFVHILKPHDPYVFDRDCETLPRHREDDEVGPYLEQVECINRLILGTVHRILEASAVPPIILLQGDHGSKFLDATGYAHPEDVPPAAARERFGAFGAYYLPGGGPAAFGDTVTVVNVLGNVLRYYFGAHLPPAGNQQYLSSADNPYEFRRLDARWLAGDSSSAPGLRVGANPPDPDSRRVDVPCTPTVPARGGADQPCGLRSSHPADSGDPGLRRRGA